MAVSPKLRSLPDRVENTPDQFAMWLARESDQWALLIRTVGIKPE